MDYCVDIFVFAIIKNWNHFFFSQAVNGVSEQNVKHKIFFYYPVHFAFEIRFVCYSSKGEAQNVHFLKLNGNITGFYCQVRSSMFVF